MHRPLTLVKAQNADAIEVSADRVIVRLTGFMGLAGNSGGPFFGVQVPRKDQLKSSTSAERGPISSLAQHGPGAGHTSHSGLLIEAVRHGHVQPACWRRST